MELKTAVCGALDKVEELLEEAGWPRLGTTREFVVGWRRDLVSALNRLGKASHKLTFVPDDSPHRPLPEACIYRTPAAEEARAARIARGEPEPKMRRFVRVTRRGEEGRIQAGLELIVGRLMQSVMEHRLPTETETAAAREGLGLLAPFRCSKGRVNARNLINLTQAAALVKKTKDTLSRKPDLPKPVIRGEGRGQTNWYDYDAMRRFLTDAWPKFAPAIPEKWTDSDSPAPVSVRTLGRRKA